MNQQHDAQSTLLAERKTLLEKHFKSGFLQRPMTIYQFEFNDDPAFYLQVEDASFNLIAGYHPAPTLRIMIKDQVTCWQLLLGQRDGMDAFMQGDYRADSNIVLSQLLLYLFKPDDPTLIYEVRD